MNWTLDCKLECMSETAVRIWDFCYKFAKYSVFDSNKTQLLYLSLCPLHKKGSTGGSNCSLHVFKYAVNPSDYLASYTNKL
jgi:hypothetical protein